MVTHFTKSISVHLPWQILRDRYCHTYTVVGLKLFENIIKLCQSSLHVYRENDLYTQIVKHRIPITDNTVITCMSISTVYITIITEINQPPHTPSRLHKAHTLHPPLNHLVTHSPTHSLTHSPTHSLIHSHSRIHTDSQL